MSNTKRIVTAVIVVIAIAGAGIWYIVATSNKSAAPATPGATQESDQPAAATITYNGSTFTLSTDKVASGSNVTVVNDSDKELDFDSDPHPVHTDNAELNEGLIAPGESATFTLETKGTWGFHNHLDADQRGSITVE